MIFESTLTPRNVYVQATEPTDKTEGKFWYNTSNNSVYVSDGTNYNSMDTSNTDVTDAINQIRLNVLINSIASSSNLYDYDDGVVDIFTDSDGASNTIDTGNTDAIFSTDKYINGGIGDPDETADNSTGLFNQANSTDNYGTKIHCNINCEINYVTRLSGNNFTTAKIKTAAGADIDSATFSGDTATFSTPVPLTAGTDYWVTFYSGTNWSNSSNSTDVLDTNINFIDGGQVGGGGGDFLQVKEVNTTATDAPSNLFVQTNALSIEADPTAIQLFCKNAVAGSGSVTYDYKIGANDWVTGNALNSKIAISDTGSTITLKLNLNGTGTGNTSEIENYCGFLYSS